MLLLCNKCLSEGSKQYIADVLPSGYIAIERRHHNNGRESTIVQGTDFVLICGNCGSTLLKRERKEEHGTMLSYRSEWIRGTTPLQETGTIGTHSL